MSVTQSDLKTALQELAQNRVAPVRDIIAQSTDMALIAFLQGKLKLRENDAPAAIQLFGLATNLAPQNLFFREQLARLCFELGDKAAAYQNYRRCVLINPTHGTACRMMSLLWHKPSTADQELIKRALAATASQSGTGRIEILFAAAKLNLDMGKASSAFQIYAAAGAMQKKLHPWHAGPLHTLVSALTSKVTAEWLQANALKGEPDSHPVFIIGMPRSGTTLVESLLLAHPDVVSAGESRAAENALNGINVSGTRIETSRRNDKRLIPLTAQPALSARGLHYMEGIRSAAPRASAMRCVDKFPGNYLWLGLIHAILPNARFIHCARHPCASALSQYFHYFGSELPYSYDFHDLANAYLAYEKVMLHWKMVLPAHTMITIRYDDLVENFASSARRLVEHCGLTWSDACLEPQRRLGLVKTASAVQVKQPVHQKSVAAWENYRIHLLPLIEALGESYDAFETRWPRSHISPAPRAGVEQNICSKGDE